MVLRRPSDQGEELAVFDVILISHGPLSKSMLESAEMICGKQERVKTYSLFVGDSVDAFRAEVRAGIEDALSRGDLLVITDIMSGSPFNVTSAAMEDLNFQHVTGMNLPLVIQVLLDRNDSSVEQTVADAMEAASECVVHVNALFSADLGEDDLAL